MTTKYKPIARPLGHLGPAFGLVRQLLSERPRTFQQLLHDGIAAVSQSTSSTDGPVEQNAESSTSADTGRVLSRKGKGKKRFVAAPITSVPHGHPFVSASFLKNRVLPVLSSQDLIVKSAKATTSTPAGTFAWSLATPPEPLNGTAPKWDTDYHWERLLSSSYSDSPSAVAEMYKQHREQIKQHKQQTAQADPDNRAARRTEKQVWASEEREEGLTTRLEREHLNVRKARGRPEKERARAQMFGMRIIGGEEDQSKFAPIR